MKKKRQYILLAGILLLAAFLRLSNSELVLFDGDESRDSFRTMNLVENGVLPGLGSELITGGNLGPLEYYLLAFPYMISGDPEFLTGFVALLNIVAVFLLYLLGRDFFNVKVGLIAAALFAFSPPAVLYSKKIWNPYFLPLFSVLFFYCVFKVRLHKEKKYILGALPAFACMLQFHISAAFLSPFVLLLYSPGLFQKEVKKHTLFGLALFVLLFLPLLAYEVKHNFSNTKNILSGTETLVSKKSESLPEGSFFLDLIEYSSVAASNINLIPGDSLKDQCLQLTYSGGFLNASQIGVFLMALAYLLFCVISKNRHEISLYLLGWFFLPFILYFFLTTFITNHYLVVQYPVQFLIIAVFFERLSSLKLKQTQGASLMPVCITIYIVSLALFQVHDIRSHYISAEKNGVINCFGLNISLKNKRKIVRSIIDDSNNNEFLYQDRVYGCEELPGAGGYNELIGGFRYLFEIEKRKQEASFQKTEETYSFLFSRVPGKVSALEGERVNQYLSWHKFPNEKELKRWQGRHNLICNPINKRSGEAKKDISVYKKGV